MASSSASMPSTAESESSGAGRQRSVSNLIGVLILEALRARGERLPEQATPPDYRQERGKQKGGDE